MVQQFEIVPISEIKGEFYQYGEFAEMAQAFVELEDDGAMKIPTDATVVKNITEYAFLQNLAQRRGWSVRSRIVDGHLFIWKNGELKGRQE